MRPLDGLVARTRVSFRPLAWLVMIFLAASTAWAYFADLEEVAIGEVMPQARSS